MVKTTRAAVDDFLAQKRIAFVGVSRDGRSFSRKLFQEFRRRGYDVVPVNPGADEIEGVACFKRLQDVQPPVDAALVLTARDQQHRPVMDCEQAGVKRVWLYGLNGPKEASAGACEFCAAHEIQVVAGYCPFMFLSETGLIHRFHRGVLKLMGTCPG